MLLAVLLATAAPIPLPPDVHVWDALGGFRQLPGAWVEYAVLPKRGPQARLKASVLAAPGAAEGRYWLEMVTEPQGGIPLAVKMLLHGPSARSGNIERIYLYVAGQAPVELPVGELPSDSQGATENPRKVKRMGTERLALAAGTFQCEVLQVADSRLYRSARVPLWGMVRALTPERRVELVGFGDSGARSVFPEAFDQGRGSESAK